MEYPIIEEFSVQAKFKFIWLKYVSGYNLSDHCAKSLLGRYSKQINATTTKKSDVHLNESQEKTYYLCGVSQPYKWKNNFHLAFRYEKGRTIRKCENGIYVRIADAVEIPITPQRFYNHDKGNDKVYNTCRNWIFAYNQSKTE